MSKLGRSSGRGVSDRNGCQQDGCKTYSQMVSKQHTNGKNGHTKAHADKAPTSEKVMLGSNGAIKVSEFQRIVKEIVEAGKKEGAYESQHEQVRQELVGIINEAFEYEDDSESGDEMLDDSPDAERDRDLAAVAARDGE